MSLGWAGPVPLEAQGRIRPWPLQLRQHGLLLLSRPLLVLGSYASLGPPVRTLAITFRALLQDWLSKTLM